jgi:hypothetical protein
MANTMTADAKRVESKKRYSKYATTMRAAKAEAVAFAFGTAKDDQQELGFLLVHEFKTAQECLSRIKAQAAEWDLKLVADKANFGTMKVDGKGTYVFSCERPLGKLKSQLKGYFAYVAASGIRFRLEATGESDEDEVGAAPVGEAAATDRGTPATAVPGTAQDVRMPADGALYKKAATAWKMTRDLVAQNLDAFIAKVDEQNRGEPELGEIHAGVVAVKDEILGHLDGELIVQLEECGKAVAERREADWRRYRTELPKTIAAYRTYQQSQPILAALDENPYLPMDVRQRLGRTLDLLGTWIV